MGAATPTATATATAVPTTPAPPTTGTGLQGAEAGGGTSLLLLGVAGLVVAIAAGAAVGARRMAQRAAR